MLLKHQTRNLRILNMYSAVLYYKDINYFVTKMLCVLNSSVHLFLFLVMVRLKKI